MRISEDEIRRFRYDANGLADLFSDKYFESGSKRKFPINPFQVLSDFGIRFVFRNFENIEALYLPKSVDMPSELVAINANRRITRQRFSAAHELCHYLKDVIEKPLVCAVNSSDSIERYAEAFASAFLMPKDEVDRRVSLVCETDQDLQLDDILLISDYFGTSFSACYYRIRNLYPWLLPHMSKKGFKKYRPERRRSELNMTDINLYSDMVDAWDCISNSATSGFTLNLFKNSYLLNDARLENVDVSKEAVAEIVCDLQNNRQLSSYCCESNDAFCHVAGHAKLYDYVFNHAFDDGFSVFKILQLHKELFSCFPSLEYGGKMRQSNPIVIGAGFETIDYTDIATELADMNKKVLYLENSWKSMKRSEILKAVSKIHHRLTVIHPFPDGNGRVSRAFLNMMLLRYGLCPFYIMEERKQEYYKALETADKSGDCSRIYECLLHRLISSHVELSGTERNLI